MKLRNRLVMTFLVMIILLIAPAMYGLFALRELRQVAYNLSTRDAVGALALGRLQTAFGELENTQRIYLALAASEPEARRQARERVADNIAAVEAELERLTQGGYGAPAADAAAAWRRLRAAIAEEQRLVEAGMVQAADDHREGVVDPATVEMDRALDPIGEAINLTGERQVARAQNIAAGAATTTLLALGLALAISLGIGAWSTRSLLRPVDELRRGMAAVAEGDFEPEVHIPAERPDELGDLARSFSWMTGQLMALDRLKAEFISVASHELKTPLSVIKGYVSLLMDGVYGEIPAHQEKILASVSDQTDRLGRLIQQLLDISRFEAGGGRLENREIDLQAFLADLATSFEALAIQNDIELKLQIEDGTRPKLRGDPDRLNEVIGNLLSNAFKFTPRQGTIRLTALPSKRSGDASTIIEVSDTGVGIPEDQISRIFEKFYQVENEAQPKSVGSGLGLAISREIVEAHGGTITAESQLGIGTTFRVYLPAATGGDAVV